MRLPISDVGKDYREYRFHPDRTLRVRVLHPDPAEWTSGVDLIYESYWRKFSASQPKGRKARKRTILVVRVAALQYKMWNGKIIHLSADKRLQGQIDSRRNAFAHVVCARSRVRHGDMVYHTALCFYGPRICDKIATAFLQRRVGTFQYVKLSVSFLAIRNLHESNFDMWLFYFSLSQTSFAELFNRNMMGSRWMLATRLEKAYLLRRNINYVRQGGYPCPGILERS